MASLAVLELTKKEAQRQSRSRVSVKKLFAVASTHRAYVGVLALSLVAVVGATFYLTKLTTSADPANVRSGFVTVNCATRWWYNGEMKTGESNRHGKWYFFDASDDNRMAIDKDVYHKDHQYWVRYGKNGAMVYGEDVKDNEWYYFDPTTGAMAKGWKHIAGKDGQQKWVYYDKTTGKMLKGEQYLHDNNDDKGDKYWYMLDTTTGATRYGWAKSPKGTWHYYNQTSGKMSDPTGDAFQNTQETWNYIHDVRYKSLPTKSDTNYYIVIDTDNYKTTIFERDGNNWRPKFLWKSVGGDVNRGHTADGQLWVFGRTSEGASAGDPWWVNFMPWREDGSEGQAFHDWKWEGRNMKGSGSDGCDMVSAANAEWIWRNIPDGTGVYSIPGWNTSNYDGVTTRFGHEFRRIWNQGDIDSAARQFPGEF